jgi:ABC-type nitrate/sulfonate/bicarbonate transport system substrate-binding protein
MPAPLTHRQQVTAVTNALEAAWQLCGSMTEAAHETAADYGFELTDDVWEAAHRQLHHRIEAARSFQEG